MFLWVLVMSRYIGPRCRLSRRCGVNLFVTQKESKKKQLPGMHAKSKGTKELSLYAELLNQKRIFANGNGGLTFKYLCKIMKESRAVKWISIFGNPVGAFASLVEMRLDLFVYRIGFAPTLRASQQLVGHGNVEVNGKCVTARSFRVFPEMVVGVRKSTVDKLYFQKYLEFSKSLNRELPAYIDVVEGSEKQYKYVMKTFPLVTDIPYGFAVDLSKVCEYMSSYV